jgi:hypothetical protein
MTTVKFYVYTDDVSSVIATSENIKDRFEQDYPESEFKTEFEEDEELFTISFITESEDVEEVDTFLCEEICQEYEYYCRIEDSNTVKEYFFDEDDEWIYKH